ncbi:HD domain-containing protein 2 [Spatholobus suberectus]|nr:HD domain-containing protein 2 [Spatholobus suberectus]
MQYNDYAKLGWKRNQREPCCLIVGDFGINLAWEIAELWMQYEANSSPQAKFVKDLDKRQSKPRAVAVEVGRPGTLITIIIGLRNSCERPSLGAR